MMSQKLAIAKEARFADDNRRNKKEKQKVFCHGLTNWL
jgi:hypothetical protein